MIQPDRPDISQADPVPSAKLPPPLDAAGISALGHDLRAAVSDIIGGLRLIDHAGLDAAVQLQLERIRTSGEVLARLLEEGLNVMMGEAVGDLAVPTNVQTSRFLYDLEVRWSGRAQESGLGFSVAATTGVPAVIRIDRIALERILSNMLSNAIKHTDAGRVEVAVDTMPCGSLRFRVSDTGLGFSREALERLFQYKGRPEGASRPGQGLGMHISKHMADRLGGRISVENLSHGGAAVTLELPPGSWEPAAATQSEPLPDLSEVKVLLADDTPTNQLLIGRMLADMGAEVEYAEDGVEALHWLEREDFDIALIDIEMPRLSGIEVIRTLRARDRLHAKMPIVAVTAYVLRANREAIYSAGADAILSKPISGIEALGMAIRSAIEKRSNDTVDAAAAECCEPFDRATFDHLIDIAGPESAQELLTRLASDLRRAERGLFAGLATADRASIRAETHVLIALAGAVGATALLRLSEALNASAQRRDDPSRENLGRETLAQIDKLIGFVATEHASLGDPR